MIVQAYQFSLKYNVMMATSGKILNTNSLIAYTSIGSVLLFSNNTTNFFNIKREIKCLDIIDQCIIMASENTLTVHDVENNFDQCFIELVDGINTMTVQNFNGQELIFIGGNCNIQGFNSKGEEICWNVASDEVSALAVFGLDKEYYIAVGAQDNSIRLLRNDEVVFQFNVQSQPQSLCGFIFFDQWYLLSGLENGQIKLHRSNQELWTNNEEQEKIFKIINCDDTQFIVGRNSKIELHQINNGQLIQKIQIEQQICSLLYCDLRGVGTNQIVVVAKDGSVQGFSILEKETEQLNLSKVLSELQLKKQDLQQQLSLESLDKVPTDLQVGVGFQKNPEEQCLNLIFYLKKQGYFIRQVVIYHDTYFKDGYIVNSQQPTEKISVPLKLDENQRIQLNCKLFVAENPYGNFFLILESQPTIPKFGLYFHTSNELKIESYVEAKIKERVPRYVKWIDQCFIINESIKHSFEQTQEFTLNTINIVNKQELSITFNSKEGKVIIRCDSITTCGDVIQDLCDFIQISELMTVGQFPKEMASFRKVLEQVQSHKSSKLQISGDVADAMNLVKSYIVKAEDYRMIGDIQSMQKMYANTMVQNRTIQAELYKKRTNNETLMNNLKQINSMISKASRLRMGTAQTTITNMCRQAVKKNNLLTLCEVIQQGREI